MAELITCPSCKKQLQVPDSQVGAMVQCPECQHQFTATVTGVSEAPLAPKSSVPPPPDDEAIADKPRRRRRFEDGDDRSEDRDDLDVRFHGEIPTYMTQAILATLCCCWPLGIVAIINASKVNSALGRGDYEGAMEASENAKKWCWIAMIMGLLANGIYLVFEVIHNGP